ncbi:hypothetical protein Cgig2_018609 [Carnegiea gigantea]|uniref:Pentatricopeptide repeat-containing protein n=1 Tax=Carnegiea gigantea TaxID=171969 RepID=A0A9Q1KGD6_9CARY|nr:hypothetical protein Cgig2_018609 [Carnegiea gigantea]
MEPDDITFTSILLSCSHEGLVDEGLDVFSDIFSLYIRKPSLEHYGCLVTLLSKCGNLDEAIRLVLTMPSGPDAEVLGSLLSACREQNQIELGECLSKYLLQLEPKNTANYVALSNVYAATGRWVKASENERLNEKTGPEEKPWMQLGSNWNVERYCKS